MLLHQLQEEVVHALKSHSIMVEVEAQREGGVEVQRQAGQAADGHLHLGGIIPTNLEAHRCSARERSGTVQGTAIFYVFYIFLPNSIISHILRHFIEIIFLSPKHKLLKSSFGV